MSANAAIRSLVVTTGGTGGHIFPALAVAAEVRRREPKARVLFLGGKGPEGELAKRAGLSFEALPAVGVLGRGLRGLLAVIPVLRGVLLALRSLRRFRPQAVVGFGGYAGFCPVLAAALLRIPTAVHEQNSRAGVTNRILGRVVRRVFVSFEDRQRLFPPAKTLRTGNPVREQIADVTRAPGAGKNLLVLGGSQGARPVNDLVLAALPLLQAAGVRLLHQAGRADLERVRDGYRDAGADPDQVHGFVDDMAGAYAWADLALCRAGASTLFELAATGTPSVLVPFPHAAHDHQRINARHLESLGAAVLAEQNGLTGSSLAEMALGLLGDADRLAAMGSAARGFATPDAAARIVDGLEELCRAGGLDQ